MIRIRMLSGMWLVPILVGLSLLASCQNPVSAGAGQRDVSITVSIPRQVTASRAAGQSAERDQSRLILATAARLVAELSIGSGADAQTKDLGIPLDQTSVDLSFSQVPVGSHSFSLTLYDAQGTVIGLLETTLEVEADRENLVDCAVLPPPSQAAVPVPGHLRTVVLEGQTVAPGAYHLVPLSNLRLHKGRISMSVVASHNDYALFLQDDLGATIAAPGDGVVDSGSNNRSITLSGIDTATAYLTILNSGSSDLTINAVYFNQDELFVCFDGGNGGVDTPYLISDLVGIEYLRRMTDEGLTAGKVFGITADIDFAGLNFVPIGQASGNAFEGRLQGVGGFRYFKNLRIDQSTTDHVGFFSRLAGPNASTVAHIYALRLTNAAIAGKQYVGALAGSMGPYSRIFSCYVETSTVVGQSYVGGFAGYLDAAGRAATYDYFQDDVAFDSLVTCLNTYGGGLLGCSTGGSADIVRFQNCHFLKTAGAAANQGKVNGNAVLGGIVGFSHAANFWNVRLVGTVAGCPYAGGIAGKVTDATINIARVSSSYIQALNNDAAGGLIGSVQGSMTAQQAYVDSTTIVSCKRVGGLFGEINGALSSTITISNCYAIGTVQGDSTGDAVSGGSLGGIFGVLDGNISSVSISNSYAAVQVIDGNSTPSPWGLGNPNTKSFTATYSYFDSGLTAGQGTESGYEKTTATLQNGSNPASWSSPPWVFAAGVYPHF